MPLCPSPDLPDRNYVIIANAAARPTGGSLFTGLIAYQVDVATAYRWNGTVWLSLGAYGFHVSRNTNDALITVSAVDLITFNNLVSGSGFFPSGFTTTDTITVPADGAGVYAVTGGVYWATSLANVTVSIVRSASNAITQNHSGVALDRAHLSGLVTLAVGDTLTLRVANGSSSNLTPQAVTPISAVTPLMPYLSAWRIAA